MPSRLVLLAGLISISCAVAFADDSGDPPAAPDASPDLALFSRTELGLDQPRIATAAAIYHTLAASPQIRLQGLEVTAREGRLLVARSPFDTVVTASLSAGDQRNDLHRPVAFDQHDTRYDWEAGVRRRFRSGIAVEPIIRASRSNSTASPGADAQRDELGFAFNLLIPLARGRGRAANEAPELAAGYDLEASLLSLRQVSARGIASTVAFIWQCRAAEQRLQLFRENETITARLVGMARSMVEAGELGRSLLAQVLADQESATGQRVAGELALLQSRLQLALAMGNPYPSQSPLPADTFPPPPATDTFPDLGELTAIAVERRDDLRASRLLVKSGKVLVEASRLQLRPAIDLQATLGYTPYRGEGLTFPGSADRGEGVSGSVAVTLEWPVANRFARGNLLQDRAVYEQAQLRSDDLRRQIEANVFSIHSELRATLRQVRLYEKTARLQSDALAAQEELFQLGEATLSDVISARQWLLQTQLQHLAALEHFTIGILYLRLETGLLLPGDLNESWVTPALWTTLPFSEAP